MSINCCNNIVDSMTNTNGFYGVVSFMVKDMLNCGYCGFNSYLTQKVRDIASKLGIVDPQYEALITNEKEGAMAGGNQILISQGYAEALENSTSPFTAEEVEGVLAHEIGHMVLDHSNSPLSDPCFDAVDNGLIKASSDTFRICFATANREIEKEADLFTLINPSFGKKLIQMFKKWLSISGPSAPVSSFDSHPRTEDRIDYLTKAYCNTIKQSDSDLC